MDFVTSFLDLCKLRARVDALFIATTATTVNKQTKRTKMVRKQKRPVNLGTHPSVKQARGKCGTKFVLVQPEHKLQDVEADRCYKSVPPSLELRRTPNHGGNSSRGVFLKKEMGRIPPNSDLGLYEGEEIGPEMVQSRKSRYMVQVKMRC